MVADLEHPRDDDTLQAVPGPLDRLDVETLEREEIAQLLGREVDGAVLAEPPEGHPHQLITSNCSRNRTSLSQRSRMSGMPNRIIASRS